MPTPAKKISNAPWVKAIIFFAITIGIGLSLALVVDFINDSSIEQLHESHKFIGQKCQKCHQPAMEVHPNSCASLECHISSYFVAKLQPTESPLRQHMRRRDCTSCHTEHPEDGGSLTLPFIHEAGTDCVKCHVLPEKHTTKADDKSCKNCHTDSSSWKNVK